jgi:hypothetical protein
VDLDLVASSTDSAPESESEDAEELPEGPSKAPPKVDGSVTKLASINRNTLSKPPPSLSKVREIAARITAARQLARKLAEEKAAASALQNDEAEAELCAAIAERFVGNNMCKRTQWGPLN